MRTRSRWLAVAAVLTVALLAETSASLASPASTKPEKVSIVTKTGIYSTGFAFSPKRVTIDKGDRVKWTNKTKKLHHILFTNGAPFDKDVPVGSFVTKTFRKRGTFHYHCTIHPTMKGTVVVT
jgi:plastocyanin